MGPASPCVQLASVSNYHVNTENKMYAIIDTNALTTLRLSRYSGIYIPDLIGIINTACLLIEGNT